MRAIDYKVSGLYLRGVLAGLRKITGQHYTRILEQAKLGRFSQKYPPPTLEVVATGEHLIQLMRLVRELVGPVVFNLFYTNLGRGFGQAMATLPLLREKSQALASSPNRIPQLVEFIGELHYQALGEKVDTLPGPTPGSLELIYRDCIYCAVQEQAEAPVCVNIPGLYKQLLLDLTGKRCQIEETTCAAVIGGTDCHFLLHYPAY